jgi:hypothetical protein
VPIQSVVLRRAMIGDVKQWLLAVLLVSAACSDGADQARRELARSESALTAAAIAVVEHDGALGPCEPAPPNLPTVPSGPFEQLCLESRRPHGAVEFRQHIESGRARGLLYRADSQTVLPPATCVRELTDHWWQIAPPTNLHCPDGYHYLGAG